MAPPSAAAPPRPARAWRLLPALALAAVLVLALFVSLPPRDAGAGPAGGAAAAGGGGSGLVRFLLRRLRSSPPPSGDAASPPPAARRRRPSAPGDSSPGASAAARRRRSHREPIVVVYSICGGPYSNLDEKYDYFGLLSLKSLLVARAQAANGQADPARAAEAAAARAAAAGGAAAGRGIRVQGRGGQPAWLPRRYEVHVVTDLDPPESLLEQTAVNRDVARAARHDPLLNVTLHRLAELDEAMAALNIANHSLVPTNFFRKCSAARLKVPYLLMTLGVSRAIYLDMDTVLSCDLGALWAVFDSFEGEAARNATWVRPHPQQEEPPARPAPGEEAPKPPPRVFDRSIETWAGPAVFGAALNDPTGRASHDYYRVWDLPRHPEAGAVNVGVLLMDVRAFRAVAHDFWRLVIGFLDSRIDVVAEGAKDDDARFWIFSKAFPLGDQDVMNAVFRKRPGWLAVAPPVFNVCRDGDAAPGHVPCILHMCGQRLSPEDSGRHPPLTCDDAWRAAADFARKVSLGYTS